MKKILRIQAIFLALSLITAIFTGCAKSDEPGASTSPQATEAQTPVETSETEAPSKAQPPAETEVPAESQEPEPEPQEAAFFPLDETEPITYWAIFPPFFAGYLSSPADGQYHQELEARTNVHVEFTVSMVTTATADFNLMAVADDFPDVLQHGEQLYVGGGDAAISDEQFVRLNDYIPEFAPDYAAALYEFDAWKDVTTDDGNIISFYPITTRVEGPDKGLAIRNDWLKKLSLDLPNTYDQLHDTLTAFKTELGVEYPMPMLNTGFFSSYSLAVGFDAIGHSGTSMGALPFYQIDGKVIYSPVTEGYKEYITLLNSWYEEGLISQDYLISVDSTDTPNELIYNEEVGVVHIQDTNMSITAANSGVEGMEFVSVPPTVKTTGQKVHFSSLQIIGGSGSVTISTNAEKAGKAELICRWLNYNYTDEGALLFNYGVEGVSFDYIDGEPQLTDLVLNNPEGIPVNIAMALYIQQVGPAVVDSSRSYAAASEAEIEARSIWASNSDDAYVLQGTMTADENSEFSIIFADIYAYVSENTMKFILGMRSLNEWDSYVTDIEAMDLAACIAYKQMAYDRYLAR